MKSMTFGSRFLAAVALLAAILGVLLLAGEAVVRDQALIFAALAALAGSAALGIVAMPNAITNAGDPWGDVAWGKFFVAITYASIAVACFIALEHTPDAARFAHAIRHVL